MKQLTRKQLEQLVKAMSDNAYAMVEVYENDPDKKEQLAREKGYWLAYETIYDCMTKKEYGNNIYAIFCGE